MKDIRRDLCGIKASCERLRFALTWDGPHVEHEKSDPEEEPLTPKHEGWSGNEFPPVGERPPSWVSILHELEISSITSRPESSVSDVNRPQITESESLLSFDDDSGDGNGFNTTSTTPRLSAEVLPRTIPSVVSVATSPSSLSTTSFTTNTFGPIQLAEKGVKYEDTAISTSGFALALIEKSKFRVFSITPERSFKSAEDFPVVCLGFNDGRVGKSLASLSKPSAHTMVSTYQRAALSDDVLCIACDEGHIDVHDARTGEQRYTIQPHMKSCNLVLSPDGKILAVAVVSGKVLCYPIGPEGKFDTLPIILANSNDSVGAKEVNCMAFSPNSANVSICTVDNVIRVFSLDIEACSSVEISQYRWALSAEDRRKGHGITSLALFVPKLLC